MRVNIWDARLLKVLVYKVEVCFYNIKLILRMIFDILQELSLYIF